MTPMIVEHPLLQHKLSILRNKQTGTKEFRDLVGEIATLLCYEATRDLPLEEVEIETPITMAKTKVLAGRKLALVPILRAGMGMLDGMLTLLPAAKVGFIGLYRDETTLQPVEYFCKLPQDIAEREWVINSDMGIPPHMRFYKKGTAESCRPVLPFLSINYFCQKCNAQAALSSTSASISSAASARSSSEKFSGTFSRAFSSP